MLTNDLFVAAVRQKASVCFAVVSDSTGMGFGANAGPNVWTNGISYGCVNNPAFGPNWTSGDPYYINTVGYISQAQFDNVAIGSWVRRLRTWIEAQNATSVVYNYGGSGYTAGAHVSGGTIAAIAARVPKPTHVLIAIGINSAKNDAGQDADLRTLVAQCLAADMTPVLVKQANIGVAGSPAGAWSATATPDQWYPMDNWPSIRANIDQVALDNGLDVIDLGTPDCALDISLLYDPFHPNAAGYTVMFEKAKTWFLTAYLRNQLRLGAGSDHTSPTPHGELRVATSQGTVLFKLDASGPLRFHTSGGVIGLKL